MADRTDRHSELALSARSVLQRYSDWLSLELEYLLLFPVCVSESRCPGDDRLTTFCCSSPCSSLRSVIKSGTPCTFTPSATTSTCEWFTSTWSAATWRYGKATSSPTSWTTSSPITRTSPSSAATTSFKVILVLLTASESYVMMMIMFFWFCHNF